MSKISKLIALAVSLVLVIGGASLLTRYAQAAQELDLEVPLGGDAHSVYATTTVELNQQQVKTDAMAALVKLRGAMWDANVVFDTKTLQTLAPDRDAYLNGIAWDSSLERIAIQRGAEQLVAGSVTEARPDGSSYETAATGGWSGFSENLAWNAEDIAKTIAGAWGSEELTALTKANGVLGEGNAELYTLLNPKNKGFAFTAIPDITQTAAPNNKFFVAIGGANQNPDAKALTLTDGQDYVVKAMLSSPALSKAALEIGATDIAVGQNVQAKVKSGVFTATNPAFTSSDTTVAEVNEAGAVKGISAGQATVTANLDSQSVSAEVAVKGASEKAAPVVEASATEVAEGSEVTLTVTNAAEGQEIVWQRKAPGDSAEWTTIDGADAKTFTVTGLKLNDSKVSYRAVLADVASEPVVIEVKATATSATPTPSAKPASPAVTDPEDVTVVIGEEATFKVSANGNPIVWQELIADTWQDMPGKTVETLTLKTTEKDNGRVFRVKASGQTETFTKSAKLQVVPALTKASVMALPRLDKLTVGDELKLSVESQPAELPVSVAWEYVSNDKTKPLSADTGKQISVKTPADLDGATIEVTVKAAGDQQKMLRLPVAFATPAPAPTIAVDPAAQSITEGEEAVFTASVTNGEVSDVVWTQDGKELTTGAKLVVKDASVGDHHYLAKIHVGSQSASAKASLTVNAAADPTPSATPTTEESAAPAIEPTIKIDRTSVSGGSEITVSGEHFTAGAKVDVELHSTPVKLGEVKADVDGKFTLKVRVPKGAAVGYHKVVALADSGDKAEADLQVIKVKAMAKPASKLPKTGVNR